MNNIHLKYDTVDDARVTFPSRGGNEFAKDASEASLLKCTILLYRVVCEGI